MQGRRKFMAKLGLGATAMGLGNINSFGFAPREKETYVTSQPVRVGFITDVHHGFCKDGLERLEIFIDDASQRELDFIMQGGDFCHPTPEGKHDMDKGTKQEAMDFFGMKRNYYSFDNGDFHFVVMDGNYIMEDGEYKDYGNANFYIEQPRRSLVNPEQIEWLREDLEKTDKQCIIISHQAFDEIWDGWSSPSRFAVRKVIDDANNRTEFQKVIACFCGHHHVDDHSFINNVHYFQMNSASYYYVGAGYGSDDSRAMYEDSLFAYLTFDAKGVIKIEGKESKFVRPTPQEKNYPDAPRLSASISSRNVIFKERE